ncbi:MAG TPA: hypothetical protein VFP84_30855, partial [Kofleriaceae bacterium]|nr:hypothetical protein [Kofleriaceae bacterium]
DYHFFGNVLFADGDPRPRVIDWSELKPGLGPHDVAYCMTAVPADDRAARDRAMLRVYWEQLRARGVRDYDWPRCQWDHRLSLIHNVVQALFQDSLPWLRHSLAAVERHAARAVLHTPPP